MILDRQIWENYAKASRKVFWHFMVQEIYKGCKCRVAKSEVVV